MSNVKQIISELVTAVSGVTVGVDLPREVIAVILRNGLGRVESTEAIIKLLDGCDRNRRGNLVLSYMCTLDELKPWLMSNLSSETFARKQQRGEVILKYMGIHADTITEILGPDAISFIHNPTYSDMLATDYGNSYHGFGFPDDSVLTNAILQPTPKEENFPFIQYTRGGWEGVFIAANRQDIINTVKSLKEINQ